MKKTLIALLFFLPCISSYCEDPSAFSNDYNHYSGEKITRFQICGERCSGTSFVHHLLQDNFPLVKPTSDYGWKHYLWWFKDEAPTDSKKAKQKLKILRYLPQAATLADSDDCLFVVIIRDPYDWLRSFFCKPHEVHASLKSKGLLHFVSSEWRSADKPRKVTRFKQIENLNPWTKKPFKNVLELRKHKNQNYLKLSSLVKNFVFVRYEDVRDAPEEFVCFLKENYGMKCSQEFIPITKHKGINKAFVPKSYSPFTEEELSFINKNLDWANEKSLGYFPRNPNTSN